MHFYQEAGYGQAQVVKRADIEDYILSRLNGWGDEILKTNGFTYQIIFRNIPHLQENDNIADIVISALFLERW